jgi:hypothetical protein|tara:strand:- start:1954 stop:2940 length:987 start_codon:yes stop_codon:yes gene_type:complete
MQDDEKIIDVGDNEEQEQEIDLDAVAPEQSLEEEKIDVEQVSEESVSAPKESVKQSDVQKGELNEYSEGVNKRIAKLTRKMREAERQKEEAIAYAQSVQQQATKLKTQNESLGKNYATELEQKVTAGMAAAKANLKTATEAGDIDAQVDAQRAIAQLSMEEGRLRQIQNLQEQRKQRTIERPEQEVNQFAQQVPTSQELYQAAQEIDPKAEDWSAKNAWFGTDNAMTYTAFDIHRKLVEEEGFDPSSNEYYSEVDRRIRLEFPHKFDKVVESTEAPSQAPVQNVASAKRPAAKGRRKTVKLTPSQVAISKRLGVPLEEYAKQLAAKEV